MPKLPIKEEKKIKKIWLDNLENLRKFTKENNRLPNSTEMKWLFNQISKIKNKKLNHDQIYLLDKIIRQYEPVTRKTWDENYYLLEKFIKENKKLPVNKEAYWYKRQIKQIKNLNSEQIKKIELLIKYIEKKHINDTKHLTELQINILKHLKEGLNQKDISIKLKCTISTIEKNIKRLKTIFKASTLFHLAIKYEEHLKKQKNEQ